MKKHMDELVEDNIYKSSIRGMKNRPKLQGLREESEKYRRICECFLSYKMMLDNNPGPAEQAKEFYIKNKEYTMPKTLLAEEKEKKIDLNDNKALFKIGKAILEQQLRYLTFLDGEGNLSKVKNKIQLKLRGSRKKDDVMTSSDEGSASRTHAQIESIEEESVLDRNRV